MRSDFVNENHFKNRIESNIFTACFFTAIHFHFRYFFITNERPIATLEEFKKNFDKKNTQIAYVGFGVRYNGIIVNSPLNALKGNFRSKMGEQLYGGKA